MSLPIHPPFLPMEAESATERRNAKMRLLVLAAVLVAVVAIGVLDWLAF